MSWNFWGIQDRSAPWKVYGAKVYWASAALRGFSRDSVPVTATGADAHLRPYSASSDLQSSSHKGHTHWIQASQALHLSALARSIVRTWIAPAEMRASFRRQPGDTHVLNSVQPLMLPRAQTRTYKEETDWLLQKKQRPEHLKTFLEKKHERDQRKEELSGLGVRVLPRHPKSIWKGEKWT